ERRFAAARRAEDDDELAGVDIQIKPLQRGDLDAANLIGLVQAPRRKNNLLHVKKPFDASIQRFLTETALTYHIGG
ncbi:hypothetical protein, partial [Rhodoblastus sp.]|uniref:hypothetical protein n=1 Tax=Rhodoblastus sp. TaxID=1962975 RepID=UPI003144DAA9